jgi:serine/threonine protein kinase
LLDSFEDSQGYLNLVLEFAPGGTLEEFFDKHRELNPVAPYTQTIIEPISQDVAIRIMRELAQGLMQIHGGHGARILHGDIHEGNIFLMGGPETWSSNDPLVKYADFGKGKLGDAMDPDWFAKRIRGEVGDAFDLMKDVANLAEDGTNLAKTFDEACIKRQGIIKQRDPKACFQAEDLVEMVEELEEKRLLSVQKV